MKNTNTIIFKRENESFELSCELWAEALLQAQNYGWKSSRPSFHLLASDQKISEKEAQRICQGLEGLFKKALESPLEVYPIRVDMGELCNLKDFLERDGFVIKG